MRSKRYRKINQSLPKGPLKIGEALKFIKEQSKETVEKFDATIELHVSLGIDAKQSDQTVRGSVAMPKGTGKKVRVWAVVGEAKEKDAKEAGADRVGSADIIADIKAGKLAFDVLVATPDQMPKLAAVAKVLGPRGLMPSPKTETIGPDAGKLIKAIKAGRANFKNDEYGIVHMPVGKRSFALEDLAKNVEFAMDAIKSAKPKAVKGAYLRSVHLASTMGPGVAVKA